MRKTDLQFSLPSFDELKSSAFNPPSPSGQKQAAREMNVIRAAVPARRLKVAAYCRVSTDKEDQKSSIRIQKEHFSSVAAQHEDWLFVGVYADIVSGTKKEKRPQLQRLLADCAAGRVNLVLTKSVSRFARNTTDLLEMVRSLTAKGTDISFERENIDTRTMDSEFLLTILASLAEDESHSISANCRWGLQKRFENGTYRAASAPYGYDLVNGNYAVNELEAEIVKEIFSRALAGEVLRQIAADLNARRIRTKRDGQTWKGKVVHPEWTGYSISTILKNVSYTGDQILQKCYTDSSFRMRRNDGQYPQFYLEEHHPAIIDRETFEAVQKMMEGNRKGPQSAKQYTELSGMLTCGCCGASLTRHKNRVGNVYWICARHRKRADACDLPSLREEDFIEDFKKLMWDLKADDALVRGYRNSLAVGYQSHPKVSRIEERIAEIDREMDSRNNIRSRVRSADFQTRQNELAAERDMLQSDLEMMKDNRIEMTEELLSLIHSVGGSFDFEDTFQKITETVTIHDRSVFTVRFLCGLEVYYDGR